MDIKVGIKVGSIEMHFEGPKDCFETKFESLFKDLVDLGKPQAEVAPVGAAQSSKLKGAPQAMTVKSIAAKLGATSGSDLVYAAIASLAVIQQKETFTRQEITDEMKLAIGYYKPTYTSNLTRYLDALSKKGVVIETSIQNGRRQTRLMTLVA